MAFSCTQISALPAEIRFYTFALFSNGKTLAKCAQVCKTWQAIANDEQLWQRLCEKEYSVRFKVDPSSTWKSTYLKASGIDFLENVRARKPECETIKNLPGEAWSLSVLGDSLYPDFFSEASRICFSKRFGR